MAEKKKPAAKVNSISDVLGPPDSQVTVQLNMPETTGAGIPAPDSVESAILNAVQADTHKGVLAAMFESESIRYASNTTYDAVLYAAEIVDRDKVDISDAMAFLKELYAKHGLVELNYTITEDGLVTFEHKEPASAPPAPPAELTAIDMLVKVLNEPGNLEAFKRMLEMVAQHQKYVIASYEAMLIRVEPRGEGENLHYHKVDITGTFYGRFDTVKQLEQHLLVDYLTKAGKDNRGRTLYRVEVFCLEAMESLGMQVSVDDLFIVEVIPTYYL